MPRSEGARSLLSKKVARRNRAQRQAAMIKQPGDRGTSGGSGQSLRRIAKIAPAT